MASQQRLSSEREFHDRQARQRAQALRPEDLRFEDATYLEHESWIEPAMAALGEVAGLRVLDLGCGHGMAAVVLARRGARVTACDLATGYVEEARARARANGVAMDCVAAAAEDLPFAAASFSRIWGNAVLHHLDLPRAIHELWRVLAPGGRAVFAEPWGENRCLSWVRQYFPYPGKQRTVDEVPLDGRHLTQLRRVFPRVTAHGHQLLAMASRLIRGRRLRAGLAWGDCQLLSRFPHLQRYCRYAVITLEKEADGSPDILFTS
jgi:ubiquinone/menaquinone biosynthesis C-methylase UbiE